MIKFGTGGWRAIIGEEFTKENIQKLALAMSLKIKAEHVEDKPVVIGYDRRFLSKEAVIWSCEILGQQGIRVLFVDRSSPTPLIMFYVMKHDLSYGMMVTASHNPAIYNGIKVFTRGRETLRAGSGGERTDAAACIPGAGEERPGGGDEPDE